MHPDISYTISPLHHAVMALQGEQPAWKLGKNTPHNYCTTFANVGLVARGTVGANGAVAFKITERGKFLARPLVGHLLDLSLSVDQPLLAFFGPTQTNSDRGIRPSERRIKLMQLMYARGGMTQAPHELADEMDLSISHLSDVAEDMAAYGILSHESSGRGKPTIKFKAGPDLRSMELREDVGSPLLFDIAALLQGHFEKQPDSALSNKDIAEMLLETGKYNEPLTSLIRRVSRKTHHFSTTREALVPIRDAVVENARQVIWANDDQLETIEKALHAFTGIEQPSEEYLEAGEQKLQEIIEDQEVVNYLVSKAKDHSIGRKGIEEEQTRIRNSLLKLIKPDAPSSVRELQAILNENGINLDQNTIHVHMGVLVKLGGIAVIETSEGMKFSSQS
jgi:hypothetical protein